MGAKSQDPLFEKLQRIAQFGETGGASVGDLPAAEGSGDLEGLFLAELRSRRERLARWVQLIHEELGCEAAPERARSPRWHQCRRGRGAPLARRA